MKYINQSLIQMYFYKPPEFSHPWEWDTRNSSLYTPKIVRDELNLIMNRPRENAFVPVLGVAYLAYQLASNYLAIQKKLIITADDILSCRENLLVLTELWHTSPQTCSQLFTQQKLADLYSYNKLQEALNSLAEKNLVKVKMIENEEQQYFPAITSLEMRDILQQAKTDSVISKDKLDLINPLLINYQGPPQ